MTAALLLIGATLAHAAWNIALKSAGARGAGFLAATLLVGVVAFAPIGLPALLAGLYTLFWIPALWGSSLEDPLALVVGGHAVNWTIFGLLALAGMLVYLALLSGMEKQSAKIAPKRQRDEARLVELLYCENGCHNGDGVVRDV